MQSKEGSFNLSGQVAIASGETSIGHIDTKHVFVDPPSAITANSQKPVQMVKVEVQEIDGHDSQSEDIYSRVIRHAYFPFLLKCHKFIIVGWVVLIIIGIKFGLQFLSSTSSDLSIPNGTPSQTVSNLFVSKYPNVST